MSQQCLRGAVCVVLPAVLFFLGLVLCVENTSVLAQSSSLRARQVNPKKWSTSEYSTLINGGGGYSLEVRTTYVPDTSFLVNRWFGDLNDVVTQQVLIFKLNNSILCRRDFNVKKIISPNKKGLVLLDAVVVMAGVVKGEKGSFYVIFGSGGCNACSEYTGYYSLEGKLLANDYQSRMRNFRHSFGNLGEIIERFGVDDSTAGIGGLKVVRTFPPQFSGKVESASL